MRSIGIRGREELARRGVETEAEAVEELLIVRCREAKVVPCTLESMGVEGALLPATGPETERVDILLEERLGGGKPLLMLRGRARPAISFASTLGRDGPAVAAIDNEDEARDRRRLA